jgi:sigma-B regulation protein RsbU (phosphoserine phosphatase)
MTAFWTRLGGVEKTLLLFVLVDLALMLFPAGAGIGAVVTGAVLVLGAIALVRLVIRNLNVAMWRLRNRLIVSYLFVAVVPLVLATMLIAIAGYVLVGQVAIYAVSLELQRRVAELPDPTAPSPEFLSNLAPSIGDVFIVERNKDTFNLFFKDRPGRHVPAPANVFDIEVIWKSPIDFSTRSYELFVVSRPSAVLKTIFNPKMEWGQEILFGLVAVFGLFLIVQLASVIIGISITRNITGAVHDLYEGTQKVKEGDFSHRIVVHGSDQLADLSGSFNRMTENLQRLIAVEKEEERLASELQIAREVQRQLFPKGALEIGSLQLSGICHPAQVVSGDYYDYLGLDGSSVALAIGDVSGKGISAALLMAGIQSALRTQLTGASSRSTAGIVAMLNRQLYLSTAPEKYASLYFGVYDAASSMLTYANAGHPPPLLVRDGAPRKLEVTGTVVGAFPSSCYEERRIELQEGDLLVAYTDGITEPENAYGEMFGEERLIDVLVKYGNAESDEIVSRAMDAVLEWTGSPELQDDMTMLIARRMAV